MTYPKLIMVKVADAETLAHWYRYLPEACDRAEARIIRQIAMRLAQHPTEALRKLGVARRGICIGMVAADAEGATS